MTKLRMDGGLTQLMQNILHEATGEKQSGNAEYDCCQRHRDTQLMPEDVPDRKLKHILGSLSVMPKRLDYLKTRSLERRQKA